MVQTQACRHPQQKEIMRKANNVLYHQTQLVFLEKTLWDKFPTAQKIRCRELLLQILRNLVLNPPTERRPDE